MTRKLLHKNTLNNSYKKVYIHKQN